MRSGRHQLESWACAVHSSPQREQSGKSVSSETVSLCAPDKMRRLAGTYGLYGISGSGTCVWGGRRNLYRYYSFTALIVSV